MYNIYERQVNVKQLSIDSLPYRKSVNQRKVWFDRPASKKCKCMHIIQDYHDRARHLKTMDMHIVNYNEVKTYYYLDITSNKVRKLKEVVRYYKKHNLTIDSKLVYYGIKSKAIKKLNSIMK